jgi:predicted nucleotidyltransferase
MKQYGLSKSKILGILRKPERKEKAIVPGLIAVMKTNKIFFKEKRITMSSVWKNPRKAPGEIWIMYKDTKDLRKIISAWRYPGITKSGDEIPIPEDIKNFIKSV